MKNMNFYDTNELGLNNEFLDKLSDNIILINNNGKILYANTSAIELYGYENDEIMNINIFDLMKKENIDNNDLFKDKVPFSAVHYRKDGLKFIGDVKILNFDISKDVMMISVSNDEYCIFDRLISNKIISKYFNVIDEALVVFTKDLNVYLWSKCAEKKFGYTADEIYGKSIITLLPQDRLDEFEYKIELLQQGGSIEGYETVRVDKNGNPLNVAVTISPMYDCKGEFMGALGIYKDITEKLELENKLFDTEERLRFVIEGSRLGIWDFNTTTNMIYTSNLFNELLGYTDESIVYPFDEIIDMVHKDDVDFVVDKLNRHLDGQNFDIEFRMKCKDGSFKWFRSKAKTCKSSIRGKPLRVIGSLEDITEKKKMTEELNEKYNQLKKLKEEAEYANKAKSQFIANVSHEIRTPLNGVFGMLQLLETLNLNKEQNKYTNLMKDSLNHLSEIINDILDISKIESGKLTLKAEPFDLKKLINNIYSNLLMTGNSKGLEISYYLDPNINFLVLGDELKLRQILDNLISNAVKFTDEGFISFRTKILSKQDNKIKVEFRVKDTGIGIGENCKNKLFQYFSQDDSSDSKKYQGTGLGLAISKQIAELFNGELTYDSKAGQGSTFTLICEFEKVISKNHSEQSNTDTLAFNNVNNQSDKYTILCIEDNIINQEVLKNIITKKGYNYLPAYNGNEAFDILEVFNIDLILMDIQLPEINGFQITKIIRDKYDRENNIPIIAITAYAMREDKEKCLSAGMNDYLAKPYELEALYNIIEANLNKQ